MNFTENTVCLDGTNADSFRNGLREHDGRLIREAAEFVTDSEGAVFRMISDMESYVGALRETGAKEDLFVKAGDILVRRAVPGEELVTWTKDGNMETVNTGREGHYVATRVDGRGKPVIDSFGHDNSWQISAETLAKKYELPENGARDGMVVSPKRGQPALFIEVSENVALKAPWGEVQKIRAGGVLNISDMKDVYGIAGDEFAETYAPVSSLNQKSAPRPKTPHP